MVFGSAHWCVKEELSWRQATSSLFRQLEDKGCIIREGEVWIPGFDAALMAAVQESFSSFSEDWIQSLQRTLWDRAELLLNEKARTVGFRWRYWGPSQYALHALLAILFFASGSAPPFLTLQLIPVILALHDESRFRSVFQTWQSRLLNANQGT